MYILKWFFLFRWIFQKWNYKVNFFFFLIFISFLLRPPKNLLDAWEKCAHLVWISAEQIKSLSFHSSEDDSVPFCFRLFWDAVILPTSHPQHTQNRTLFSHGNGGPAFLILAEKEISWQLWTMRLKVKEF